MPKTGLNAETKRGLVVSVSRPASEAGQLTLDAGGNAVDAAIAVAFALSVTWPEAGNIGGGGFMLVHDSASRIPVVFDYRERAPAAATVDMFASGDESPYRHVGVPGTVRGMKLAHDRLGKLPWKALVLPAVALARDGFAISEELARSLNKVIEECRSNDEFLRVLGKDHGKVPWAAGDRLVQSDLAKTLLIIAEEGADAFYSGRLADAFEAEMKRGGGLITAADLADYQPRERTALHGTYRGYDIYGPPPPSSGGTALIEMLNMVERFDLRREGRWSAKTLHLMIESMRRAYFDRARYLGDPDFTTIPTHLTTKDYATELAATISPTTATSSAALGAEILSPAESPHTTHFSVIDADGMAVSNTYTLENDFGSRIIIRGAGVLLNDEMADFNPKPGVTNTKGLIGTKPNQIAPGKRMLSSMCPVIVAQNGQVLLVTGSPGGRTIINTSYQMVLNIVEFEMSLRDAVDAPRLHHAWMPELVRMEKGLIERHAVEVANLREMGHTIELNLSTQGDAHSILVSPATGIRTGAVDPRRGGWAAGQ